MSKTLNWGILGAGAIAKTFAKGVARTTGGKVIAIGSRSQGKADLFGDELGIARRYGSYEALLADAEVEAVYIATPHPEHAEWAIKTAEAKKHVLCEKPIGMNFGEAMAIVEAARDNDVFLMEAFMYRCHPQTQKLVELVKQKAIGDVRLIQATFGFRMPFDPKQRIWANELGGGGILDVGCYPVSMVRLIAGAATGRDFADPISVCGAGHLHPITRADEYAIASLQFAGGIVATVATSVGLEQENVVRIYGTEGYIFVPNPWLPGSDGLDTKILIYSNGQPEPREIAVETPNWLYAIEADTVAAHIDLRQAPAPAMSWDDTLGNMKTLDQWRQAIGLTYDAEKPENVPTVHRKPLAVQARGPKNNMKHGSIAGVTPPVSRLVMGVDNETFSPVVAVLWDDFFEHGGNCFDTAFVYDSGRCEKAMGDWVRARKIRSQVVIVSKGGHTPECFPGPISRQHRESLDRLQTDYADLYMLHRDNPAVPVGEFVDVLNEHVKSGTMKAIGVSNWSLPRVQAFNDWAKKNGKTGLAAISNQLSLARMIAPPWSGCLSANDPEMLGWLAQTQTPLMPWSSQGRGFFLPSTSAENHADAELVRCWHREDNFRRLERARELAKKKKVLPINIALAFVLHRPFPTFALIGPRTIHEIRSSLRALDVELTEAEMRWLNLED